MTNRIIILLFSVLLGCMTAIATPNFSKDKLYYIVCQQFPNGCVTDGSNSGQQTPMGYLMQKTVDNANLWKITEKDNGQYYIQNAKTGQYVTYDGVREGDTRRYVSMTDQPNGNLSLWTVTIQTGNYFTIRNVGKSDHLWDVRVSSLVVGTYSNSGNGNANQLFAFYDETGKAVNNVIESAAPLKKALDGLCIGPHAPIYTNDQGGYYLHPTPAATFGTELSQTISYTAKDGWGNLQIDGR